MLCLSSGSYNVCIIRKIPSCIKSRMPKPQQNKQEFYLYLYKQGLQTPQHQSQNVSRIQIKDVKSALYTQILVGVVYIYALELVLDNDKRTFVMFSYLYLFFKTLGLNRILLAIKDQVISCVLQKSFQFVNISYLKDYIKRYKSNARSALSSCPTLIAVCAATKSNNI